MKEEEMNKLKSYINNFEQELKKMQNALIDERMVKEEAVK